VRRKYEVRWEKENQQPTIKIDSNKRQNKKKTKKAVVEEIGC